MSYDKDLFKEDNQTDPQAPPKGYVAPKIARVGGSYYELRADGHRRLPDDIDYVADMEGIAPSFKKLSLRRLSSKKKRNGGPNRKRLTRK